MDFLISPHKMTSHFRAHPPHPTPRNTHTRSRFIMGIYAHIPFFQFVISICSQKPVDTVGEKNQECECVCVCGGGLYVHS